MKLIGWSDEHSRDEGLFIFLDSKVLPLHLFSNIMNIKGIGTWMRRFPQILWIYKNTTLTYKWRYWGPRSGMLEFQDLVCLKLETNLSEVYQWVVPCNGIFFSVVKIRIRKKKKLKTNLTKWMTSFVSPGVLGLITSHGNLRVSRPVHGALVDVGWPNNEVLIVHNYPLGMHVDHEPSGFLNQALHSTIETWFRKLFKLNELFSD